MPLHQFVLAIATDLSAGAPMTGVCTRLDETLTGWARVEQSRLAALWCRREHPTQMGWRPLSDGWLVGLDFPMAGETEEVGWGAYVSVRQHLDRRAVAVRRDPTGRVPAWRLSLTGVDLIFSHLGDVLPLCRGRTGLNWDYIGHHLQQDWLHGAASGFAEITELLPGQEITYDAGQAKTGFWWRPHAIAARPHAHIGEAERALRSAGDVAARCWAARYKTIVLDLSGGLDSSIVLGLLRRSAGHDAVIGLNKLPLGGEGDERAFARAAAAMHGVKLIEAPLVAPDHLVSDPRAQGRSLRPQARLLSTGYDELGIAIAREHNAAAFFTGTGGDHLFGSSVGAIGGADYLHHGGSLRGLPRIAAQLARASRDTAWAVMARTLRERASPPRQPQEVAGWGNPFAAAGTPHGADFARFTHPIAAMAVGEAPPAKFQQVLFLLELQDHYKRYGRADVAEETHILFSQPMLEAALRTPAHWFAVDDISRGLARRAFADLLPPAVRERRSKGGSTHYYARFMRDRLPALRSLLLEGRLSQEKLLDRDRLEAALTPAAMLQGRHLGALLTCLTTEFWVRQAEQASVA